MGERIVYRSSWRPSVRVSVRPHFHIYIFIYKTSRPNATKFYLKHHWGEGKAALGFGLDRIMTLVSMATDSSHRVIIGEKRRRHVFSNVFDRILLIPAGNDDMYESLDEFKICGRIRPYGVSGHWAYEKKIP